MIYLNQGALQNYVAGPVLGNERLFEVDFSFPHPGHEAPHTVPTLTAGIKVSSSS